MNKLMIVLATLIGFVAVPTHANSWDDAYKQYVENCKAGAPKAKGYMTWRANCLNTAIDTYQIPRSKHDADLWQQLKAFRSAIAARMDRGEISIEDGDLAIAQYNSQLVSISQSRRAERGAAAAADRAANQQLSLGLLNLGLGLMSGGGQSSSPYIMCNDNSMVRGTTIPNPIICH
jgi:hypothetical protein